MPLPCRPTARWWERPVNRIGNELLLDPQRWTRCGDLRSSWRWSRCLARDPSAPRSSPRPLVDGGKAAGYRSDVPTGPSPEAVQEFKVQTTGMSGIRPYLGGLIRDEVRQGRSMAHFRAVTKIWTRDLSGG
jgi:hypothetical protein